MLLLVQPRWPTPPESADLVSSGTGDSSKAIIRDDPTQGDELTSQSEEPFHLPRICALLVPGS